MIFWITAITGLVCSYIAWRVDWISGTRWFRWGGLALCVAFLVLMYRGTSGNSPQEMLPLLLMIVVTFLCWAPFLAFFLMHALVSLGRSAVSLDNMKLPPSYSQAEGAAAQKDFRKALLLYHQAALEQPEEPEPHRRMGELFLLLNLPDDAIASFRDAQNLVKEPGDQLPLVFRISEILADYKRDASGAIRVIEGFLSQHPNVEGRDFAEERLRKLRACRSDAVR